MYFDIPELGIGNHSISNIKDYIRKKRLLSRYARKRVNNYIGGGDKFMYLSSFIIVNRKTN